MPNAMPYSTPTQDTREEGAMKSLNAVAGSLLARLPKNGRAVSLATVTANMWGARTSQGRCDTVVLVRQLEALCAATGVECKVKENPNNKGDWVITLRY
jgi:hypothetical protein